MQGRIATAGRKRAAVELVAREDAELRQTARRFSLCEDDAEDAYQRALEILLVKAPSDRPRELIRWMKTVVKHEALAIRRYRERMLGVGDDGMGDPIARIASGGAGPDERLRARRADRPQPRGAAGAEAGRAALADPARRRLLLRRDRRDHRLQPDEGQSLPGRGPGALSPHAHATARTAAAAPSWPRCSRPTATARRAPRARPRSASTCAPAPPAGRRCAPTARPRRPSPPWPRLCPSRARCSSGRRSCSSACTRAFPARRRGRQRRRPGRRRRRNPRRRDGRARQAAGDLRRHRRRRRRLRRDRRGAGAARPRAAACDGGRRSSEFPSGRSTSRRRLRSATNRRRRRRNRNRSRKPQPEPEPEPPEPVAPETSEAGAVEYTPPAGTVRGSAGARTVQRLQRQRRRGVRPMSVSRGLAALAAIVVALACQRRPGGREPATAARPSRRRRATPGIRTIASRSPGPARRRPARR